MKEKPDPNVNHSDDIKALEKAKNTIGDYKLKMDPMFNSSDDERDTKLKKFQELLKIRQNVSFKLYFLYLNQNPLSSDF